MIGRDQKFSQFLVSRRWLHVLANASSSRRLIGALDDYLGRCVQTTEYHFQMRQFVAFYAVAKNLESLLLSLERDERCGTSQQSPYCIKPESESGADRHWN